MAVFVLVFFGMLAGNLAVGLFGDGLGGFGQRVALVEITGEIESSEWPVRQIRHYAEQDQVGAIVVRLDSPGGGVAASQEIFEELGKARDNGKWSPIRVP